MKFEFADFRNSHCEQYNTKPEMFYALWERTNGDPCTTGCAWYGRGQCLGYKRLIRDSAQKFPVPNSFDALNNAGLAEMLGVSKRQISKMRKNGTLNEMIDKTSSPVREEPTPTTAG